MAINSQQFLTGAIDKNKTQIRGVFHENHCRYVVYHCVVNSAFVFECFFSSSALTYFHFQGLPESCIFIVALRQGTVGLPKMLDSAKLFLMEFVGRCVLGLKLYKLGYVFDPMNDPGDFTIFTKHRCVEWAPVSNLETSTFRFGFLNVMLLHRHRIGTT